MIEKVYTFAFMDSSWLMFLAGVVVGGLGVAIWMKNKKPVEPEIPQEIFDKLDKAIKQIKKIV